MRNPVQYIFYSSSVRCNIHKGEVSSHLFTPSNDAHIYTDIHPANQKQTPPKDIPRPPSHFHQKGEKPRSVRYHMRNSKEKQKQHPNKSNQDCENKHNSLFYFNVSLLFTPPNPLASIS